MATVLWCFHTYSLVIIFGPIQGEVDNMLRLHLVQALAFTLDMVKWPKNTSRC